ncbi:MAG: carbamoyltransferase HypF [Peptococcaceae bacterium]|nr:carbamoyltransferase HypF [Peptococcaceae bacterium]
MKAYHIHINGIVQGVGFRPFVYKLAEQLQIKGWVNNSSDGLDIHAEGKSIEEFYRRLLKEKPPLAYITSYHKTEVPIKNYQDFNIVESQKASKTDVLISPDVATCKDCLREMCDQADRRYLYPFINCTNCGPRYSIIYDRPYDRHKTTMQKFVMCSECKEEYENPHDRRFHAQPVSCDLCGPVLQLLDSEGKVIQDQGLGISFLQKGAILAVKGLGGFHLVCDAYNHEAVKRLRTVKERGAKPFALMARDIPTAAREVEISDLEEEILESPAAPIVLLRKTDRPNSRLSSDIAPGLHTLGVMLPYTPIHHLLFQGGFEFLVMTSANLSGQPLIFENEEALTGLKGIADYFLVHNRDIYHPCDDSVVQVIGDKMTFIRRARGFVPLPLLLKEEFDDPIAGLGAEMKNAFCLASGKMAFMSQYIGDMHGYENFERFKQEFDSYQKVADIFPRKVAYDMHPDYATTKLAKSMVYPKCAVQHHHAHHVSVMTEHGLSHQVLGISCDGTGYGEDGKIWGFEYLFGNAEGYLRKGHLEYLPLPGGDAGAKFPVRIAYAYLRTILSEKEWPLTKELWTKLTVQEKNILEAQLQSRFQLFDTSSAGRLFDAVSGLLNICTLVTYEGQAAIELESRAATWVAGSRQRDRELEDRDSKLSRLYTEGVTSLKKLAGELKELESDNDKKLNNITARIQIHDLIHRENMNPKLYPVRLQEAADTVNIKINRFLRQILEALLFGTDPGEIAFTFHYSLACAMLETALVIGMPENQLVISGGVFQNKLLTECLLDLAKKIGVTIYYPGQMPSGDGGLALGQVMIANRFFRKSLQKKQS